MRPDLLPGPGDHVVVVSPHLDDAIFSLGATCADLTGRGVHVTALTLFAGDPGCSRPAGSSNRRAGFATVGEAARRRRLEDNRACVLLGVTPLWLPYNDDESFARDAGALTADLAAALAEADVVLVPGHPLRHPDHRLTTDLVLRLPGIRDRLGFYIEQPYAAWETLRPTTWWRIPWSSSFSLDGVPEGMERRWATSPASWRCYLRKMQALHAYRSQLAVLRRLPRVRVALSELLSGGERVAWPTVQ